MLKNLKSLFFVEEPSDEKKEAPKKEKKEPITRTATQNSNPAPIQQTQPQPTYTNSGGTVDEKIIEKLLGAFEKNNLEGFDYLEFKKAIKALEKLPMDEATKFRSTYATASTLGVTLDKLISSTGHYINILENENTTFLKAFEGQLNTKVGNKKKEILQIEAINKEKAAQIKRLTDEITKNQANATKLKEEIAASQSKISITKNNFKISYLHLRSQLEQDVEKMKQYLK